VKRKTSTTPTRIYCYGALAPTEGAELVREQLRLASRYYNALTAIEQRRRAERREAPDKEQRDAVDERAHQALLAARAECGCYWGTYLLVEQAAEQARKTARIEPHFSRFDGGGRIGVQIQHGMPLDELCSGRDTRLHLIQLPSDAWDTPRGQRHGTARGKRARTEVRIRVGSDEHRHPIWATFPVIMHRPLPADSKIMGAWVLMRRVGFRLRYELQIVLETALCERRVSSAANAPVAVDFGWRSLGDGSLRVAQWRLGEMGGSLVLPAQWRNSLRHVRSLESIADYRFDQAKRLIRRMRRSNRLDEAQMLATTYVHQWRSAKKLGRLVRDMRIDVLWREWIASGKPPVGRWARDRALDPVTTWLELWRRQDMHLRQWAADREGRLLRERREIYRRWAVGLAREATDLVVRDSPILVTITPVAGEPVMVADRRNSQRTEAAISTLRAALVAAFGGGERICWADLPVEDNICPICSSVVSLGPELQWQCDCGKVWDRDDVECRHLLDTHASGAVTRGPQGPLAKKKRAKNKHNSANHESQVMIEQTDAEAAQ
jgi:hypothetical protein